VGGRSRRRPPPPKSRSKLICLLVVNTSTGVGVVVKRSGFAALRFTTLTPTQYQGLTTNYDFYWGSEARRSRFASPIRNHNLSLIVLGGKWKRSAAKPLRFHLPTQYIINDNSWLCNTSRFGGEGRRRASPPNLLVVLEPGIVISITATLRKIGFGWEGRSEASLLLPYPNPKFL